MGDLTLYQHSFHSKNKQFQRKVARMRRDEAAHGAVIKDCMRTQQLFVVDTRNNLIYFRYFTP